MIPPRVHRFADPARVAETAAQRILAAANRAIAQRGAFHLVLAGGTTPRLTYEKLAQTQARWESWHIYFGDERCLPPGDPERNDTLAAHAWLDHVSIPFAQIHPIPAEQGPHAAAQAYREALVSPFDLVLLGMGEDGHAASLFPGHHPPAEARVVGVENAPKPPPERVSLTPRALADAHEILFLITGGGKHEALRAWLTDNASIPAATIQPATGVDILADEAALGAV